MEQRILEFYNYLEQLGCQNITAYNLTGEKPELNYAFIVTNATVVANKNMATKLMQDCQMADFPEGYNKGEWIVFDFGDFILHSFVPEQRLKYNLDKMWQTKKIEISKQNKQ